MTPNLGTREPPRGYFEKDHSYVAKLELSTFLKEQVGDGNVVIQIESDMHEAKGWDETMTYTGEPKQFQLFEEKKTWGEAEAFCQHQGGHLASIVSESENQEVTALAAGDFE